MGIQHLLKTVKYTKDVVEVTDDLLKKIQTDVLGMMDDISKVLDEHNIRWFMSGGSVLGAVRHKGFIPWDDDFDIFMEREEFEKFKVLFDSTLDDKYRLRCPGDPEYYLNLPRITKNNTTVKSIQSNDGSEEGLPIDIFILENTYDNILLRFIHGIRSTIYLFIDSALRMDLCKDNIFKYTRDNSELKREVLRRSRFAKLFRFRSLEDWLKKSDRCFSSVKKKGNYLVCPSGARHFFGEVFPKYLFESTQFIIFENREWPVPCPAEKYLVIRYGNNYMKVPPIEEREKHVYAQLEL